MAYCQQPYCQCCFAEEDSGKRKREEGDDMVALEAAVAGTRLQGFVSGGTVQPDQRTQDEAAAAAAPGVHRADVLGSWLSECCRPGAATLASTAFCSARPSFVLLPGKALHSCPCNSARLQLYACICGG